MERAGLLALLSRGCRLSVLTGAGVSAESGVPTFRGHGGLWASVPVEEVATPQGFAAAPLKVWRFYDARRVEMADVRPNPAHTALARMEAALPGMTLITQNIDDLHRVAGSSTVIELHGNLWRLRCTAAGCNGVWTDRRAPLPALPPACPRCGAMARPDVVWFNEPLPMSAIAAAQQACSCDLFLVVGTSATVYPAASLPGIAQGEGAVIVEVNVEETALTPHADLFLRGRAGEILPALLRDAGITAAGG